MKFILVISLLLLLSCNDTPPTNANIATLETYYEGLNTSNFARVHSALSDTITFTEGEYATNFTSEDYYVMFQWDSVFTPQTTLSSIQADQNQVAALVSTTSQRYTYLGHTPYTCEAIFTFENNRIRAHETVNCPDENRQVWESKRDTLIAWIDRHHPELSGFAHDLTKKGAENYLKAIHLYENR